MMYQYGLKHVGVVPFNYIILIFTFFIPRIVVNSVIISLCLTNWMHFTTQPAVLVHKFWMYDDVHLVVNTHWYYDPYIIVNLW
jgi:hypothetical protein